MRKHLFILTAIFCILSSCKKDEQKTPLLFVSPTDVVLKAYTKQVLRFTIQASSPAGLSNMTVNSKELNSFTQLIIDSTLNGSENFYWIYEYKVPDASSSYQFDLSFVFTDQSGYVFSAAKRIQVTATNPGLNEYTGNVFYSKNSGKEDSYNLINHVAEFSSSTPSALRDLQNDESYDSGDVLGRSWVSPSGSKFVRFNGYSYDNATSASIKSTYDSGIQSDTLTNIQQGDIIFMKVKRNTTNDYIVIKVTSVFDLPGSVDDTYIFNLKK
jgi:hypothetical protein